MNKIIILIALMGGFISTYAQQDTIIKKSREVTVCTIDSITQDAIHFRVQNKMGYNYKLYFKDVSAYCIKGKWEIVSTDSVPAKETIVFSPVYQMPPTIPKKGPLEKAGLNIILGTTIPVGGGLLGNIMLNSKSEGVKSIGAVFIAGSCITGFVCIIMAGVNLMDAQKYIDNKAKGFSLGNQPNGVGIGYRF